MIEAILKLAAFMAVVVASGGGAMYATVTLDQYGHAEGFSGAIISIAIYGVSILISVGAAGLIFSI